MRHIAITIIASSVFACSNQEPTSATKSSGGTFIDGGGDLVNCRAEAGAALAGSLSMDYVLTYNALSGTDDDPTGTAGELLNRVTTVIDAKLPELSTSWRDYLRLVGTQNNNEPRVWRASAASLGDVHNTDPVRDFPDNCIKTGPNGEDVPDLKQLVRRRYSVVADVPKVLYEFDANLVSTMKAEEPLQYAYLIVHEWLWDYVESGYNNRWVNRLLNSKSTESMTPGAVRDYLRTHGFQADVDGVVGQPSPLAQNLANQAANSIKCDAARRASITFTPDTERLVLEPTESLTLHLDTPRIDELLGSGSCGVGFFYAYRTAGLGSASGTIELRRGGAVKNANFNAGSTRRQEMWYGLCGPNDCLQRDGDLAFFFSPQDTGVTSWQLRIKNTSAGRLEVTVPHLTFYGLR